MASATLTGLLPRYPSGSVLTAYPRESAREGKAPVGSGAATATVTSAGTATFTTLTSERAYSAYALVSSEHRYVAFSADAEEIDNATDIAVIKEAPLNVQYPEYGATGSNSGDDSVAIQEAIDDAYVGGGGEVLLPAGQYRCLNEITLKAKVGLSGHGQTATKINFPTDLGEGAVGITMQGSQTEGAWMQNLHMQGSGSFEIGVQNCDMDGVQPGQSSKFTDVSVYGFRAGVRLIQDHQIFTRCKFANCYYGVLYDDDRESNGNQQFYSCFIEGNNFACVAVLGNGIIDYALFVGGNAAQSPYGFYKGDGPITGASELGLMSNTILLGFAFEGIGNAAIWDESTGSGSGSDSMMSCFVRNVGFSWGGPTLAIADRSTDYAVKLRNVTGSTIEQGSAPFSAFDPAVGNAFKVASHNAFRVDWARRSYDTSPMFSSDSQTGVEVYKHGGFSLRTMTASGTIAAGDLLEYSVSGPDVVQRYSGLGTPFAGVAVEAATDGQTVLAAREGAVTTNLASGVLQAQAVRPDPTTQYTASRAPSHGFAPTTGIATSAPIIGHAISSGSTSTQVFLSGHNADPFYVKPSNVTALPTASSTYRGQIARIEGGSGVADGLYICQKKADNSYAWQQVTVT